MNTIARCNRSSDDLDELTADPDSTVTESDDRVTVIAIENPDSGVYGIELYSTDSTIVVLDALARAGNRVFGDDRFGKQLVLGPGLTVQRVRYVSIGADSAEVSFLPAK